MAPPHQIPARRLAWLNEELERWHAEGLVDAEGAGAIAARYSAGTRVRVVALLLGLGAALLGAGLIWLVASNLDLEAVGPLARFAAVATVWLVLAVAAEAFAGSAALAPLTGPARLLSLLAYGGAIFQAAQSLQVPAYDPGLVAAWAAGGLLYAYATAGRAPLVAAVALGTGWLVWSLGETAGDVAAFGLGLALAVPACVAAAALHDAGDARAPFAGPWRTLGALLGVASLLVLAFLDGDAARIDFTSPTVAAALAALVLVVVAVVRGAPERRLEVVGAVALLLAALALIAVAPEGSGLGADGGGYAFVLMLAFVAWAVGVAVVGAARDAPRLVDIAFAGLLLFVAVQSFGIIGSLVSGAALLLSVGAVLFALGFALDRGRRRLLREAGG